MFLRRVFMLIIKILIFKKILIKYKLFFIMFFGLKKIWNFGISIYLIVIDSKGKMCVFCC